MGKTFGYIFDFNGVLFWDTHLHDEAWRHYSRKLRGTELTNEEMKHHIHGRTNKDALEYLTGSRFNEKELAEHTEAKETLYRNLCLDRPEKFQLAPGAIEFFDYLKAAKIPFTIATSSGIGNLRFYFRHLRLARWFELDLIAFDDGKINGKPAPDLYLIATQKLELPPENCIVVEDSRSGIASAHNARIGSIIALGPKQKHAELSSLPGVNRTIVDFYELLNDS